MQADDVLRILEAFRASGMASLTWSDEHGKLSLKASQPVPVTEAVQGPGESFMLPAVSAGSSLTVHNTERENESDAAASGEDDYEKVVIKAPVVGVFFSAPNPDEDPFTEEGAEIKAGDVLCIIEAMKLMNEVVADEAGIIREVLVSNGEKVEYGQPLFVLEPLEENQDDL